MSKISLEPNASGAGTFTLAAPNSNTNRTLTLPDEAGKLLSTGNDDPAEIFKQSNILGTVSESGGVPTGAIIECGSNSNGEFVKYADGTMICTSQVSFNFSTSSFGKQVFSYPASFVAIEFVNWAIGNGSQTYANNAAANVRPDTAAPLTDWGVYNTAYNSRNATEQIYLFAIGRWY